MSVSGHRDCMHEPASGCCAVRLCVGERGDGVLFAWRFYDCALNCSSTLWLLPFTLLWLPDRGHHSYPAAVH